ncbi:MAG TPA: hypothetical protein VGK73_06665 [Polyangiaceae bacterium]
MADALAPYGAGADDEAAEGEGALEMPMGEMHESEPMDDFGMAVSEAMPEVKWTPERLGAFKEAIRICLEEDKAGGYGPASGDGGDDLAVILGAPSKKS